MDCKRCNGFKKVGIFTFKKCKRCNGTGKEPVSFEVEKTEVSNNQNVKLCKN